MTYIQNNHSLLYQNPTMDSNNGTKFSLPKLSGTANYISWSIRAKAYLIRDKISHGLENIVSKNLTNEDNLKALSTL